MYLHRRRTEDVTQNADSLRTPLDESALVGEFLGIDELVEFGYGRCGFMLAEKGPELTMSHCRYLKDGVRELRFEISRNRNVRIAYWFPGDHKIILLTVFTKSAQREASEVDRAVRAKKVCENERDRTYHSVFET